MINVIHVWSTFPHSRTPTRAKKKNKTEQPILSPKVRPLHSPGKQTANQNEETIKHLQAGVRGRKKSPPVPPSQAVKHTEQDNTGTIIHHPSFILQTTFLTPHGREREREGWKHITFTSTDAHQSPARNSSLRRAFLRGFYLFLAAGDAGRSKLPTGRSGADFKWASSIASLRKR